MSEAGATNQSRREGTQSGVKKWPVVGVLLAGLWLMVRGVELTPARIVGEFLIGLAVGLPIAFGTRKLYLDRLPLSRTLRALPLATYYVVLFLKELLTANIDVAYRVLHPSMPIEPDVVEFPLRVQTDGAITTIANSITLTPGTLTMEHDEDTNTLYVHGIVGRRREAVVEPIRRWEDLLLVVFDEEASPSDDPRAPPKGSPETVPSSRTEPTGEPSARGGDDDGR